MKNNSRRIIGVDLDDTLLDFNNSIHAWHNNKYGTNVIRKDITSYGLHTVWKCTKEDVDTKLAEFYPTKELAETSPVQGSLEAIDVLKTNNDLHVITIRGDHIAPQTSQWIDLHFPNVFSSICMTNEVAGVPEKICSKADICKRLKVDIMVEDSISQAIEIANVVERVYLLDCPWNQGEIPHNVIRVQSWGDIIKHLIVM